LPVHEADRAIRAWLDPPRNGPPGRPAGGCVAGAGAVASGCRAHIPGRCEISGSPVEIRRCSRNCEAPSGDKPGTLLTPRCKPSEEGVARVAVGRPPETSLLRVPRRFFYVTCGAHRGRGGGCAVCVGSYASAAGSPLLPVAPMTKLLAFHPNAEAIAAFSPDLFVVSRSSIASPRPSSPSSSETTRAGSCSGE
jgi:hypothetical protein